MKKLKNLLQYNYIFYTLLILSILYTLINTLCFNPYSKYNEKDSEIYGYIIDYKIDGDKLTIILNAKEKIIVNYYFNTKKEKENYKLLYGDYIYVKGKLEIPKGNTNFNLFNYRKYLLSQKIKYIFNAEKIEIVKENTNVFYNLKINILNRINKCKKSSSYLKTFIFADKSYIDYETYMSYQKLGISHLLAISGTHVSLISLVLFKIFNKLKEKNKYLIVLLILFFYLFLTNFTISMLRAYLQFMLFFLNKILKLNIKNSNIIILLFSLFLFYSPYNIYNIGFIFSFTISFTLVTFNKIYNYKNLFYQLLIISVISFLVSIPIVVNNFYHVNFFSILYNIFYVPYVSYILFPISLLTIVFPFLDNICYFFINVFESVSFILSNINVLNFDVAKLPLILIIIYYAVLVLTLKQIKSNKSIFKNVIIIFAFIVCFINYKSIVFTNRITIIDVGQGDSTLIRIHNRNILIDTGGKMKYVKEKFRKRSKEYNLSDTLISYFKSEGVKKIDYLILTHGDFDHMGESINLVNNFKVNKVVFNCDTYNDLEQELIKVLDEKQIKYYCCIKELNIDRNKLQFLNTKEYDNENDNSSVIYLNINNYKFLFMGDAGVEREKDILNKYNLNDIDFFKVGHHGSDTSSSEEFIESINPKYSLISVGKNNKYGHPKKTILDILKNSKIYRTDQDGSIEIKLNKNGYKIETCSP